MVSRLRRRTGKARTQQIKKVSIGKCAVCLKAIPLQEQEALVGSVGFRLRDQARFADACLTTNQSNLPLTSLRLVNEHIKGCQVSCTANQDWANDWLIRG